MRTAVYTVLFTAALVISGALAFDASVSAQSSGQQKPAPRTTATPQPQGQDDVREDPVFVREVQLPITVLATDARPRGIETSTLDVLEVQPFPLPPI